MEINLFKKKLQCYIFDDLFTMNNLRQPFRNVIFDLGEVLLDLAIPKTIARFSEISGQTPEQVKNIYTASEVFLSYEKGLIDDAAFRSGANELFGTSISDVEFDSIWNGMLHNLSAERLSLLNSITGQYRLFLLSNTNEIHIRKFTEMAHAIVEKPLESYFEKTYYSNRIKMRKPDHEIFHHVLKENNLLPEETLFLDDNFDNISAAQQLGIQTIQVTHPSILFQIFS
jgi:putative hydrolase of the HAD superfamily